MDETRERLRAPADEMPGATVIRHQLDHRLGQVQDVPTISFLTLPRSR
jgi:hypothetical protein